MRATLWAAAAALAVTSFTSPAVHSEEAPQFMRDTYPQQAVEAAWQEFQAIMQEGELDAKTKELVALVVAAQVPCEYCVYYHTEAATAEGATDVEIREALAAGALVRKWSTMLNGTAYDEDEWREQVDDMFEEG